MKYKAQRAALQETLSMVIPKVKIKFLFCFLGGMALNPLSKFKALLERIRIPVPFSLGAVTFRGNRRLIIEMKT